MENRTLSGTINAKKHGWWSDSGSHSGTSATLKFTFPSFTEAKNYIITNAVLYLKANASGANDPKTFKFTFDKSGGPNGKYTTNGKLYNRQDYISFKSKVSQLQQWFSNGGRVLTATDPSTKYHTHSSGATYSYNYVIIEKAYWVITYTIAASDATFDSTDLKLGEEHTVYITAHNDSYLHDVNIVSGDFSYPALTDVGDGTLKFTPNAEYFGENVLPNSTSAAASIVVNTKNNGTIIGTKSYSATLFTEETSDFLPTVEDLSCDSFSGEYILGGITSVPFEINGATGKLGATIAKYQLYMNEELYGTSSSNKFSVIFPNKDNTITAKAVVIDSRGYSAEIEGQTFYVNAYAAPSFTNVSFSRFNRTENTEDEVFGDALKITYTPIVSSLIKLDGETFLSNEATVSLAVQEMEDTFSPIISGELVSKDEEPVEFKTDTTYNATLTIIDQVGYYTYTSFKVSSSNYLLHFRKNQKSIGIGCAADDLSKDASGVDTRIRVGWPLVLDDVIELNKPLDVAYGGTGAGSVSGALKQLGALSIKEGGTMEGSLITSGLLQVNNDLIISNSNQSPYLRFQPKFCSPNAAAEMLYNAGSESSFSSPRFQFKQYSPSTTEPGKLTNFTETYSLPSAANDLTENKEYEIVTTKGKYKVGDTVSLEYAMGWISSSGGRVYLEFPVNPQSFPETFSCTNVILKGQIRGMEKYALGSSSSGDAGQETISGATDLICRYISAQGLIFYRASLPTKSDLNNYTVQFNGSLTFTIA